MLPKIVSRHRICVHTVSNLGGSPGLVVMGDDSCLRGCEFESRHHKLDGHNIFSRSFVVKIVTKFFEKMEN